MIRLDNISKQNGHQILFIEASATLLRGEKAGLVGPNGAGKTTLFRMITGRSCRTRDRSRPSGGFTIGISARMSATWPDCSAVAEVMDGAGPSAKSQQPS